MDFRTVRALRGPNVWTRFTALEATVELGHLSAPVREFAGFASRLTAWLPDLGACACSPGTSGVPFVDCLQNDTTLAHVLERTAVSLQTLAGSVVSFGRTVETSEPGVFRVVVEYREEEVGRLALEAARSLCLAAIHDRPFDVPAEIKKLRSLDQQIRLGPSTNSIVSAAVARGIPYRRLNSGSLVQLGYGSRQHRILAAETDRTSAIGESIAQDKELTKSLLKSVGVPVPEGRPVRSADEAWEVACEIGVPVVVKPQYGNQGRGVAVNLTTRDQVMSAFQAALDEGSSIIVEKFAPGFDHRLLVIGNRVVAAARREPPQITGDGRHTIAELVEIANTDPRRGEDHATPLSKLRLDSIALAVLAEQGLTPEYVPAPGQIVVIRRNANLSTGGSATDVTERVHPDVAARAVDAARVVGLDIAGVDVVALDVSRPLEDQQGVIVEVNAAPGLRMHLEPSAGTAQPVGDAIVGTMFAPGETGRIPIVAVTGTNGKTTTTRLVAHILRGIGLNVGMTCTDGVYLNSRRIDTGDCSGPKSARSVLLNPQADAAVLETARGGILREGLGFDFCDVAVVTNIAEADHLGLGGLETAEQVAAVKRTIVEAVSPRGAAVLNAEDPLTAAMAHYCPGSVIYFARDESHPIVVAHRARGGRAVFIRSDAVVTAEGEWEGRVASLASIPLTHGGRIGFQVENVLAATAAAWSVGVPAESIRVGLSTFISDMQTAPGRFNVLAAGGATIIVDYGHNASALLALIAAIERMPHERRVIVYTAAGDRRDVDIIRQAEIIGDGFDHVVIYEDQCTRGRPDGEVIRLMREGLSRGKRVSSIYETRGEFVALEAALQSCRPGDVVLLQADQVDEALAFIDTYLATHPIAAVAAPPVSSSPVPAPLSSRASMHVIEASAAAALPVESSNGRQFEPAGALVAAALAEK
jgi:cyanophycin synthetase